MTDISSNTNGRPSSRESPGPRTDILSPTPTDRIEAEPIFQGAVDTDKTVVVCGAGGFIGGHLVADLLRQGYSEVRASTSNPRTSGSRNSRRRTTAPSTCGRRKAATGP